MASAPILDPETASVLKLAVQAAQRGDLPKALALAEKRLANGGDAVALNAFLGMLQARSGNPADAVSHLRRAHLGRPGDVTIACNLIATLSEVGDFEGALDVASADLSFADPTLRVARYRGFAALSLERFEEAEEAYAHVVAHAPDDFASWNNLGNARTALGKLAGSVEALERAVALDPDAPPPRVNLAAALRAADRFDDAEAVLRQAVADFPKDATAAHELYVQFKREGRDQEALDAILEAVGRDPANASLQLKLGVELGLYMRVAEAEAAFRAAIALDPQIGDAYLGLAIQYEHSNREGELAPLIALAEAQGLDEGTLGFIRALEFRRIGAFQAGLDSLSIVPEAVEPERTAQVRATLLDRLGRTDEAFAAFEECNRLHALSPTQPLERAAALRSEIADEIATLTPEWLARWSPEIEADDSTDLVFLVGFPRSGTTLLDTILMGHPDTVVLEEQPPLNLVNERIGGMQAIASLDAQGIAAARRHYFEEVANVSDYIPGKLLIDKAPLFLHKVPLIRRLFPRARFILALRHPCDVLLSCFMSNFKLNDAMSNFLRLEDAAALYDLTFDYWERANSLLSPNVYTIVYERLVEDVAAEVHPLFDILGLDWNADVLDHQRTAKSRGLITTASYSQVTEPIYKRASGRWKRYRTHLAPVLPTLAPWVEKFGYAL